jgi:hypothetical protein
MSDPSKNITCKIQNGQKCYEKFGIHTENDLNNFIGAEYNSVHIGEVISNREDYDYMVSIEITIDTNKGKMKIQFYNEHNGYYSHDVFIQTEHESKHVSL